MTDANIDQQIALVRNLNERRNSINEKIHQINARREQAKIQYRSLLAQAKEEFGCSTVEELKELLERKQKETEVLVAQYAKDIELAEESVRKANAAIDADTVQDKGIF